ncbi:MAG: mechanosensitive ion channel [Candidatus Cloacimonetes bacterium]|nr:mechanosensitive ion channel [Candidatus Cloacimonadota bacterium]
MVDLKGIANKILEMIILYGPTLIVALITLIIGLWLINTVLKLIFRKIPASKVDVTLATFLRSIINIGLKVLLWITVISMLGVKMTSFVALLGAAGLAVGLSLQGSLANFAGGVLIMFFKPFQVGDFIESQGHAGTVHSIQVFHTILKTPDNKTIIIPNGSLSNSNMVNYSREPTRRVDLVFGIAYNDDIKKAKVIMMDIINADNRILQDPPPQVSVSELGDSSVNFVFRVWVNTVDYWPVYFDMQERVKLAFDEKGISIPFPQRDIHIYNHQS